MSCSSGSGSDRGETDRIPAVSETRFSPAHLWVRRDGEDAILGVTEYLQDQLGDITTIELPDFGDVIGAGRRMGRIESEDAASPLESPVTGEVVEVNSDALDSPDLINSEPYEGGWLLRVRLDDASELDELMSEEEYMELTTEP